MTDIANLRRDYKAATLDINDVSANPIAQFRQWFEEAVRAEITEPNAMTLATMGLYPSARTVLLKDITTEGSFTFFTNYESHKANEIADVPRVALLFCWLDLERQIRITGDATRVAPEVSTAYFQSRPKSSQIGAWVSPQSKTIASRAFLEQRVADIEAEYRDQAVLPRPEHWGGYRVQPLKIEFWQGRRSRLHDRILYTLQPDATWCMERLAP